MRRTRSNPGSRWRLAAAGLAAVALLALGAAPAWADGGRQAGRYGIEAGFGDEPAYAGNRNSVQVIVSNAKGEPVRDLGDTLKVMVMAAGHTRVLPLEPGFGDDWGTPGDYRAWFI